MAAYSIKDLEKLSGIKAHTLRVWEQRYDFIKPHRTDTNIRFYDENHLKHLLNVAILTRNGFRISKIAVMAEKEMKLQVSRIAIEKDDLEIKLDLLKVAMIELNGNQFESIIVEQVKEDGFEMTMSNLILPFLDIVYYLWVSKSIYPVHENFVTIIIRQKLIANLDALRVTRSSTTSKFILFAPEGEDQELSLLFLQYLIKSRGNEVIYIGMDLSKCDIETAYKMHKPDYMCLMILQQIGFDILEDYLNDLCQKCTTSQVLVTGIPALEGASSQCKNLRILESMGDFITAIEKA